MFFSEYVYRLKTRDDGGNPPERGMTARIVGEAWKKMSAVEKDRYEREACGLYGEADLGGGRGGGYPRYLHHPPSRLEPLALEGVGGESTMMASPSARDDDKRHPPDDGDGAHHRPPEGLDQEGMPYLPPPNVYLVGGYGNTLGTAPPGGQPPAIIHQVGGGAYDPYAYGHGIMPPPNPYDHMYGCYPPPYAIPPPGMLIPPMYGHHPPNYQMPPPPPHHPPYNPTYDEGG